jgi:hypothetical protein
MKPSTFTQDAPREFAAMTGSRPNLAHEFLRGRGETVGDWDGVCGELANELVGPEDSIIWVGGDIQWRYHMVPLIGGLIHDAWCEGDALPLAEWLAKMFGDSCVTVAQNGDDFYEGPADEFKDENKDSATPVA